MSNPFSLEGKNAWITGGSYGIGFNIAKAFVAAGAKNIIFNDINEAALQRGLDNYKEAGITNVFGYVCDVTKENDVKALVDRIHAEVGQIDILVNNAGIIKRIPMHEMKREEFQAVIDVDLVAPYIVSSAVLPEMMERREGKIINICSMMSELGRETVSAYAAAKGGLKMLTRNICSEYGEYNIQCNGIGPGYIATPQTAPLREKQPDGSRHPFDSFICAKTPAGRWLDPSELGGPAVFLASHASDAVNGRILGGALLLAGCSAAYKVEVYNPLPVDRIGEITGFDASLAADLAGKDFVLVAEDGAEVPYQKTHDGKIIFPATVKASSSAVYTLKKGAPSPVDTIAYGRMFPERKDDIAWENDKCAFRTYGPALVASGQHAYGYDAFTKSATHPILEDWYYTSVFQKKSIHHDHGTGMDAYEVGPTLGCGASGLLVDGEIVHQWGYETYEILDQGPLRVSFLLNCYPKKIGGDTVVEHRLITLDAGTHLNRASLTWTGLSGKVQSIAGVVVHKENPDEYSIDPSAGTVAYADPMTPRWKPEGKQFTGAVFPEGAAVTFRPLTPAEDEAAKDGATGHLAATVTVGEGSTFSYLFGTAWSKVHFKDLAEWDAYLHDASQRFRNPLTITVTKK